MAETSSSHEAPPVPPPPPATPHPPPPPVPRVLVVSMCLLKWIKIHDGDLRAALNDFMWNESAADRKLLSHEGAVRCFQAPQSAWNWIMTFAWRCPHTGESYFDPTNAVYSQALATIDGGDSYLRMLSKEMRGDLMECVLGMVYTLYDRHHVREGEDAELLLEVRRQVEEAVRAFL